MTVLIVESHEGNARIYAKALSRYDVHICTVPADVPELLNRLKPDALIINLFTMREISNLPYRPKVIIGLTYFASDDLMKWAEREGIDQIILLPCSLSYLANELDRLLHTFGMYRDDV